MKHKKLIIFISGGTGGHVFPAISLSESLDKKKYEHFFITDERCQNIFRDYKLNHKVVCSGNFSKNLMNIPLSFFKVIMGFFQTLLLFLFNRPSLVIGFGGYTSVPSIIAAKIIGVKTIIHEQNAVMGRANIFLSYLSNYVAITYKKTIGLKTKNHIYTGIPIRKVFFSYKKKRKYNKFVNILIIGGSQGAKIFSTIIPEILNSVKPNILEKISVVQQAKKEDINKLNHLYKELNIKYSVKRFFKYIDRNIYNADIVISRSGASSLAEIEACSKFSLLFPLPSSMKNHQYENAIQFKKNNTCFIFNERKLDRKKIVDIIEQYTLNPRRYNFKKKTFENFIIRFEKLILKCLND